MEERDGKPPYDCSGFSRFELPAAVQNRLQMLLDEQDDGDVLTEAERCEAEGLVELAEFLSLLCLRAFYEATGRAAEAAAV